MISSPDRIANDDLPADELPRDAGAAKPAKGGALKRWLPLLLLAGLTGTAFAFGLQDYLSFEALRENRVLLMELVEQRFLLAALGFILIYAAATAVSLPGGALLSIAGGFLFGPWLGTLWVVLGATAGASAVFLIARTALGDSLRRRAGPAIASMEAGFRENAFSYLLTLRLIPLFPFFLVNLVPAFLGMRLGSYGLATFIGIIPGAFVFTFAGAGLGSVFDANESFSPASVLTPEVIAALVGLGLLSLAPVLYKRRKAKRASSRRASPAGRS